MPIPSDVILIWTGTHAGIPAGYSRETDMDSKYPLGCSSGDTTGGGTGGSFTHTHTVLALHTHSFTLGLSGEKEISYKGRGSDTGVTKEHVHRSSNTGVASSVTYQTGSSEPYNYEVIFIKSAGTHDIPEDVVGLFDADPGGDFVFCDGDSSTPSLATRYLRGAGTGEDAGGTGTSLHLHNASGTHTHISANSGPVGDEGRPKTDLTGGSGISHDRHQHICDFSAGTVGQLTGEANAQKYRTYYAFQNQGSAIIQDGIIGMWKGLKSAIPENWAEETLIQDRFIKNPTTSGSSLQSAGNNTHTHSQRSHSHAVGVNQDVGIEEKEEIKSTMPEHKHDGTVDNTTVTVTYGATLPPYIDVFFIKYTSPIFSQVITCTA